MKRKTAQPPPGFAERINAEIEAQIESEITYLRAALLVWSTRKLTMDQRTKVKELQQRVERVAASREKVS